MASYSLQLIGDNDLNTSTGSTFKTANEWNINNPNPSSYRWIDVFTKNAKAVIEDDHWKFTISAYVKTKGNTQIRNWSENPSAGIVSYLRIKFYSDSARTKLIGEGKQALSGSFITSSGDVDDQLVTATATGAADVGKVYVTAQLDCGGLNGGKGVHYLSYDVYIRHMYEYGVFNVEDIPLNKKPSVAGIAIYRISTTSVGVMVSGIDLGKPTAKYQIRMKETGGSYNSWSELVTVDGSTFIIEGLTPGTSYQVQYRLSNAAGYSDTVTSDAFTTYKVPHVSAISAYNISTTSASIMVSGIDVGVPEAKYQIRMKETGGSYNSWSELVDVDGSTFIIEGLTPGTSYQVQYRLSNIAGTSDTVTSDAFTTLQAPSLNSISATITSNSITVTADINTWGNPKATAQYSFDNSTWKNVTLNSSNKFTINNLSANTTYRVYLKLTNSAGSSTKNISITTDGIGPSGLTITNGNPYTGNTSKSASWNSIKVNFSVANWGTPTATAQYCINDDINNWKSATSPITLTSLQSYTQYKVTIRVKNTDKNGTTREIEDSITIRTAERIPNVTLSVTETFLDKISCNYSVDMNVVEVLYRINKLSWMTVYNNASSPINEGTFIIPYLQPSTTYSIEVQVITAESNNSASNVSSAVSATTTGISYLSNIGQCIFGNGIKVTVQHPSASSYKSDVVFEFSSTVGHKLYKLTDITTTGDQTFTPTQQQLDEIYKLYPHSNTNEINISLVVITHGEVEDFNSELYTRKYTLTGIAKTAHIGVNESVKRAQCFIGINGTVRRAVAWIGTKDGPRRCI